MENLKAWVRVNKMKAVVIAFLLIVFVGSMFVGIPDWSEISGKV